MANSAFVSELSGSATSPLENGPETSYVVDAIDAFLQWDVARARYALIQGAEATSWSAIAHRLDVAGHALALDAGLRSDSVDDHDVVLLPGLDTSTWVAEHRDEPAELIARWSDGTAPGRLPVDRIWSSLAVVAWLVDRAGYPAEVVV